MNNVIPLFGREGDLSEMSAALKLAAEHIDEMEDNLTTLCEAVENLQTVYNMHIDQYIKRVGLQNADIEYLVFYTGENYEEFYSQLGGETRP